jgi:hypothetical protein
LHQKEKIAADADSDRQTAKYRSDTPEDVGDALPVDEENIGVDDEFDEYKSRIQDAIGVKQQGDRNSDGGEAIA